MGSLFTSLINAGNSLQAYSQAMEATQNNVENSQTPGYARQIASFLPLPFDPSVGLPGGVIAGPMQSTRSAYAEQAVQQQQTALGFSQQQSTDFSSIQSLFSLSSQTGITSSLNNLFQSFSALSINPNDPTARQTVIGAARQLAQAFNAAGNGLGNAGAAVTSQTQATISSINQLASQISQLNAQRQGHNGGQPDAAADANLNADLEQLSQYAGVTALQQPDGSISVYLGGQVPVVLGNQAYAIQGDFSLPQARILDAHGNDVTSQLAGGQLGAEIDMGNNKIPSYLSSLNSLAQGVADQVNNTLAQGVDQNGAAPVNNLFTYSNGANAAQTFAVNPLVTPDQIAAALPTAPGGNGNALNLAALATAPAINGFNFTQFYGNLAGQAGNDIANANQNQTTDQQLVTQAQSLRSQVSGVSLDAEAANLVTYQRSYQAVSEMVTVINSLTNSLLTMIPPGG